MADDTKTPPTTRLPNPNMIYWRGSVKDLVTDLRAIVSDDDLMNLIEVLTRTIKRPIPIVTTAELDAALQVPEDAKPEIQRLIEAVAQAEINYDAANAQYAEAGKYVDECHRSVEKAQAAMRDAWRELIDRAKQAELDLAKSQDE